MNKWTCKECLKFLPFQMKLIKRKIVFPGNVLMAKYEFWMVCYNLKSTVSVLSIGVQSWPWLIHRRLSVVVMNHLYCSHHIRPSTGCWQFTQVICQNTLVIPRRWVYNSSIKNSEAHAMPEQKQNWLMQWDFYLSDNESLIIDAIFSL